MLKILNFFKSATGETKVLSMRERFDAAQREMNAVLSELPDMPSITIDASERSIDIAAPDQFADEALALPAPDPVEDDAPKAEKEDDIAESKSDADTAVEGDASEKAKAEAA